MIHKKNYPHIVGICKECQQNIIAKSAQFDKPNRKYCSYSCKASFLNKNRQLSEQSRQKLAIIAKKRFTGTKHSLERRNKMSKRFSGSNSHFWKDGLTTLNSLLRNSSRYKIWRMAVFMRDDYTCRLCKNRNGLGRVVILNADHKKPFSVILVENNIKTVQEGFACPFLWDVNNGQTLCIDCHKKTETFGIKARDYRQIGLFR